jgi:hypothetical protein
MALSRDAIDRLAGRYGFGHVGTVSKLAGGTNDDCHRVGTERGDFVFKVLGYDVHSVQLD